MIIERTENPTWLSNAYLIAEEPGGKGVLVDGNDELGPLLERVESDGIRVEAFLLTHAHPDHVAGVADAAARLGGVEVVSHPEIAERVGAAQTLEHGEVLQVGAIGIEAIHTPGHAAGHLAYMVGGTDVLTADVLFKGTVGGTVMPDASGLDDLRSSIMDRLMDLPGETRVHPGHREPTTIQDEWEQNPFIRVWRGQDEPGEERCTVWDREATLILWAPDYDGGNKAWVRFEDSGEEAVVGGSQVIRP